MNFSPVSYTSFLRGLNILVSALFSTFFPLLMLQTETTAMPKQLRKYYGDRHYHLIRSVK
jgi:hypothetical protein